MTIRRYIDFVDDDNDDNDYEDDDTNDPTSYCISGAVEFDIPVDCYQ